MRIRSVALAFIAILTLGICPAAAQSYLPANAAVTAPDENSWSLFYNVVQYAKAGQSSQEGTFETWATDADTFQTTPAFPGATSKRELAGRPRALLIAKEGRVQAVARLKATAATTPPPLEIVFRNEASFNYIVSNNLYKFSGLIAANGTTIQFPQGSIEIKTNWVAASTVGNPAQYHLANINGASYALVAMHITSKEVPNWTWATFENVNNVGRCDYIGCHDSFGSQNPSVPPQNVNAATTGQTYLAATQVCTQTPALAALIKQAAPNGVDPVFANNYCLKGSQVDFTTPDGLAFRLGNSVTEGGFVQQSSCMTCHGRAGYAVGQTSTGSSTINQTSNAGFDLVSGTAPIGPVNPAWFYTAGTNPPVPMFSGESTLIPSAQTVDFIWSIPFCAINDLATPPQTKSTFCSNG